LPKFQQRRNTTLQIIKHTSQTGVKFAPIFNIGNYISAQHLTLGVAVTGQL